jgi:FKBP-type peptidyl-prolyl cis-trans isomerase
MPLVRVGDELRVILPSHLAFGFTGDGKKIPGDSPVLYEIKVVTVQ